MTIIPATPEACVKLCFTRDAQALYASDGQPSVPQPATGASAGVDVRAAVDEALIFEAGERGPVPTGLAIEPLVPGLAAFIYSRSGLGAREGLVVAQGVGVIDPDYRGELTVWLLNTSRAPITVKRGERIAQLLFQPFLRPRFLVCNALGETERGAGGFGHTGR